MSVLLAIETSTDAGSIALGRGPEVAGEVLIGSYTRHAETLLPALEFLLASTKLARGDIDGIVVGAGPGSFTGVRIAAASARGLALGLGVPLYAYSSLAALAADAHTDRAVCALFDARRGEVYAACYRAGETLLEPDALPVAALLDRVREHDPVFVGEGAVRYAHELGCAPPALRWPRASALLRLAAADPAGGRVADGAAWEPSYLRASGAERGIRG
ncbi:MAG TPA: tRNA (adenosine(37)-N6)-threonylcarbamoyltransferase complex dimerization subunit type 1 TsaB [Longimicrobiales bacterium]|nr:tRNA (adenosine(37)-N6)-threonylcarbamoyltransferase complex dimerization subunit type 1 TsaB [Longimicrobiales bacterium]